MTNVPAKEFGTWLRTLRERKGLSRMDVVRQSADSESEQISPSLLTRLELGHYPRSSYSTLHKIARGLGISIEAMAPGLVLCGTCSCAMTSMTPSGSRRNAAP